MWKLKYIESQIKIYNSIYYLIHYNKTLRQPGFDILTTIIIWIFINWDKTRKHANSTSVQFCVATWHLSSMKPIINCMYTCKSHKVFFIYPFNTWVHIARYLDEGKVYLWPKANKISLASPKGQQNI